MKKFLLIDKQTYKVTYKSLIGPQIFETENDTPEGLLGGEGQIKWYWLDVTNLTEEQLSNIMNKTHIPNETIPENLVNFVTIGGSWE